MNYRLNFVILFLIAVFAFSSCQHFSTKEAVKVNDEVVQSQKQLMSALESFVATLEGKDEAVIETALDELKNAAKKGVDNIDNMTPPECSSQFLPAAKNMFSYYLNASDEDYKQLASLYSADSISYEAYDSLEVLVNNFRAEQEKVNNDFLAAQRDFAKHCGFKLVRNAE